MSSEIHNIRYIRTIRKASNVICLYKIHAINFGKHVHTFKMIHVLVVWINSYMAHLNQC